MSGTNFIKEVLSRIKGRIAWRSAIIASRPIAMITLGTNKPLKERKLMRLVSRALHDLDCTRFGNARRMRWKFNGLRRLASFIAVEKVELNTHAHLIVYSPSILAAPDSLLTLKLARTRAQFDLIGWHRNYDDRNSYASEKEKASKLETIWRRLVPGGHYHATWIDSNAAKVADYVTKELPYQPDRDIRLSQEFWDRRQKNIEKTFLLDPSLRPTQGVI